MRIAFCGTAASALTPPRAASCVMLEHEGDAILLDCGPGSLERVLTAGLSLPHIKGVLFSHLHMDHVQGFPELLAHMVFPFGALPFVCLGASECEFEFTFRFFKLAAREKNISDIEGSKN